KSGQSRNSKQTKQLLQKRSKTKQNEHDTVNVNDNVNDIIKNKGDLKKSNLVLPFKNLEFIEIWNVLIKEPKWKNKSINALNQTLEKLSKESEQDAIQMMKNTIAGNWQ